MSERLTDEELDGLNRIIMGDDGVRPIMFPWMARAIEEIRTIRAAALTGEEREALRVVGNYIRHTRGLEQGSIVVDRLTEPTSP